VHYFTGNAVIPGGTRKGILVVRGNLSFANSGSPRWDGIVLVGGKLDTPGGSSPEYVINGIIVTGLNIILGQSVPRNQITTSNSVCSGNNACIQWDWCYARNSMAALPYLVPIRGTFMDSWKTY
jgi:hypothetical protein